jgi:hypothetical protein
MVARRRKTSQQKPKEIIGQFELAGACVFVANAKTGKITEWWQDDQCTGCGIALSEQKCEYLPNSKILRCACGQEYKVDAEARVEE